MIEVNSSVTHAELIDPDPLDTGSYRPAELSLIPQSIRPDRPGIYSVTATNVVNGPFQFDGLTIFSPFHKDICFIPCNASPSNAT